jgi:hypothetical protein
MSLNKSTLRDGSKKKLPFRKNEQWQLLAATMLRYTIHIRKLELPSRFLTHGHCERSEAIST